MIILLAIVGPAVLLAVAGVYLYRYIRDIRLDLAAAQQIAYEEMVKARQMREVVFDDMGVYLDGQYCGTVYDLAEFYLERERAMGGGREKKHGVN